MFGELCVRWCLAQAECAPSGAVPVFDIPCTIRILQYKYSYSYNTLSSLVHIEM